MPCTVRYTPQGVALVPRFMGALRFAERWPWTLLNGMGMRRWGVRSYPCSGSIYWPWVRSARSFRGGVCSKVPAMSCGGWLWTRPHRS